MAGREVHADDCGCCAGVDSETPRRIENPPAQTAISYRVGNHARFKESLLSRLSSSDYPALGSLGTRDDDDFTIALCDALATTLDVFTFYQERIANEHYLRTATEERSVSAMARLIGYVPSPGVAASTYLAFTLQTAPGDTKQSAEPVTIPEGTRVQSVPGQDEKAQMFETVEDAEARVAWNAVAAQQSQPWRPASGDTDLYLEGVATQLQPGDAILIVGAERENEPGNENWDVRVLDSVKPDTANDRTRVTWTDGLGHVFPRKEPAAEAVQVYALRLRAALFGHNAPDPNLMSTGNSNLANLIEWEYKGATRKRWLNYAISTDSIDLDSAYPKITAESWIVLVSNEEGQGSASLPGYVELYRVETVRQLSRTGFGLSAKITQIKPDTYEHLDSRFSIRETLVLAQSEALATVARPLLDPVYGDRMALDLLVEGLVPGRPVAISGKRQRIAVAEGVNGLKLTTDEGEIVPLAEGDSLFLMEAPVELRDSETVQLASETFADRLLRVQKFQLRLKVLDRDDRTGTLVCFGFQIALELSREDDPEVSEIAFIASGSDAVTEDRDHTSLKFSASLTHCYERATVRVCANVARATHGETVIKEIVGGGDASRSDQSFTLRQSPLTYVSAQTPSGRESTLELRVNDLLWSEVASLYGRQGDARVYTIATDEEGVATARFGDGVEGARLPTGQNNVRAVYRKGLGTDGNVAAGKLTNLLTRPLGVMGATNPEAASGGEDRESLDAARENAPLTVLTLDRAVSIKDYADFARAFAGIAKAHALWIPAGPARGVFLTVAGIDGAGVDMKSDTYLDLLSALRKYGDPLVPIHLVDHLSAVFRTRLTVKVAADHDADEVLLAVEDALRANFGFDKRDFGRGVSIDEVMSVAHDADGVEAVQVTRLYRPGPGVSPSVQPRLFAALPVASLTETPQAAELLTLDDAPLELEELP